MSVWYGSPGLAAVQRWCSQLRGREGFAALACKSTGEEQQDCCLGTGLVHNHGSWMFVFSQPWSDEGLDQCQVTALDLALGLGCWFLSE